MFLLVLGILVFVLIHLVPSSPSLRARLFNQWGEKKYKGIFSLIALIGLLLIIFGKAYAPFMPLWNPPIWGRHLAMTLMPFSFILLAAANMPSNIKRFIRHPMLWGVTLWAMVHLLANGDTASLLLFGGFGLFSLYDMWSANRRGATLATEAVSVGKEIRVIGGGIVVYGVILFLHPYLFGVPVLMMSF